jgi:sugar lactone lactonase YvrE
VRVPEFPSESDAVMVLTTVGTSAHVYLDQINVAVKDRFQALHQQLGAASCAKQDSLVKQRGHLKDLRTQATSVLTRVRSARAEASDTTCVMAYAELVSSLETMSTLASGDAVGETAADVVEAPVSMSSLRVTLDTTGVLAAIGRLGQVQVRPGWFVTSAFTVAHDNIFCELTVRTHACRQTDDRIGGVFLREINGNWGGMAVSPDGQFLVVLDRPAKSMQVLRASDRSLVRSIGQGTIKNPRRLAISPDGTTVFVSDGELQVVLQYRMDGTLVRRIGSKGNAPGQFDQPWGLVVSKAGLLFVADSLNHRVQIFRVSDGTYVMLMRRAQVSINGQFNMPLDVALSPDETQLLILDMGNHRIQVFDARGSGLYLRGWGSKGSADGQFQSPQSIVVTGSGEVLVADMNNHRVCVFDLDGTFRRSIGSQGSRPGQFESPSILAYSRHRGELMVMQDGAKDAAGKSLLTAAGGRFRVQLFNFEYWSHRS